MEKSGLGPHAQFSGAEYPLPHNPRGRGASCGDRSSRGWEGGVARSGDVLPSPAYISTFGFDVAVGKCR